MTKPIFSLDQIVNRMTRADDGTPDYFPQKDFISYSVPDVAPPSHHGEQSGFVQMTPFMQAETRMAFELWDDLIEDSMRETTPAKADITFAFSANAAGPNGPSAYTDPSRVIERGDHDQLNDMDIWIHPDFFGAGNAEAQFAFGGYGLETAIHEIGHALGLDHPGNYNGTGDYQGDAVYSQDTRQYTIMSYFAAGLDGSGVHYGGLSAQTPLLHDVMAIQSLYGADMMTRTGDTTYGFNATAVQPVYDFTLNSTPILCIWDAGGADTLDLSGAAAEQFIDLRAGSFSSVMGLGGNLSIAYGCTIENAVGGQGRDALVGNEIGNQLLSGGGNDQLFGLEGNDSFLGSAGDDVETGGQGQDAFYFSGASGIDLITDFEVGTDHILLDRALFKGSNATLSDLLHTQDQGWAWLDLNGQGAVVFQGVTEAVLESRPDSVLLF